jgi:glyoxylase-like metal-dependent hydrolase (beta-lactamase superfamily II)
MIHTLDLNFLNVPQAIAAYLIETSAGPILIESGPYSTHDHLQQEIKRVGFAPADIRHVLLTHIHFDHAGAAWAFAEQGATIYVHPAGAPHLAQPEKLWNSAQRIYGNEMDRLWGKMQPIAPQQLHEVAHEEALTFGDTTLTAYHTPGHATHHIAYQLDDLIFTGDVGGVRISGGLVEPPCPPPDINVEDWQASIELLRGLRPSALYLTHFGRVDHPADHCDRLHKQLTNWADWVRAKMKAGQSAEETVPQFTEYVANQLRAQGASEEQIKQYEAANPSWMSVAGLMRYWKKHDLSAEK